MLSRGKLNFVDKLLICIDIIGLYFSVEYHLEYRFPEPYYFSLGFEPVTGLGCRA